MRNQPKGIGELLRVSLPWRRMDMAEKEEREREEVSVGSQTGGWC
jgi:hypothetical protein